MSDIVVSVCVSIWLNKIIFQSSHESSVLCGPGDLNQLGNSVSNAKKEP